jgi:hypothetical protein
MFRRPHGVAAFVLLAAALVAGCGGDDGDASSANTPEVKGKSYADTVCFIAVSWEAASGKIDDYRANTASSQDVVDAVSQAQAATSDYVLNIRGLQQPDDATGKEAFSSLQATADDIADLTSSIQTSVDSLETDAPKAQAQIQSLYDALKTSVTELDGLYPDSGVAAAVDAQSNCAPLQAS